MKKKYIFIYTLLACCLLFCLESRQAQAADSYKCIDLYNQIQRVGKTTFEYSWYGKTKYLYAIKNDSQTLLASGTDLSSTVITNGSTVYYYHYTPYKSIIYSIASNGKKNKKLHSVKAGIQLNGYYSGKIYYSYGDLDNEKFCSFHIKKRKSKTILKNLAAHIRQQDKYFYITPADGDISLTLLRVYNAKTGKTKTISKHYLPAYTVISNQLYYAEGKDSGVNGMRCLFTISLKKCNLSGSHKKTLVKNLKISGIDSIKKHSITYYDANGRKKTKKF